MSAHQLASAFAVLASGLAVASVASVGRGAIAALERPAVIAPKQSFSIVLARIGSSRLGRRVRRDRLEALVAAAGSGRTIDELVGVKLTGVAAVVSAAVVVGASIMAAPFALLAWRGAEISLARRARRRVLAANREVPLFLDLLAVASSAGVAPQLAMRLATDPLEGPLAAELRMAIHRTDLGRRWRDEIAAAAERLHLSDLRRVTAILTRSEALGSALADEVARLAADVRAERRSSAAERARTAPVRMLFPLVFLILPAFLLLTVVPVLLSTVRSIA